MRFGVTCIAVPALCLFAGPAPGQERPREEPTITVIGTRANLDAIPGSGAIIDGTTLRRTQPFSVNEVLRRVPGILPREEEGAGLRPNIGIRGLNPTRSTKVLLLEDGLPLSFAPYGDNASYYHPSIERFARIEVLKGAGQIAFGPQTIGGVINYITPDPPETFGGEIQVRGGNRGFSEIRGLAGTTLGDTGLLVGGLSRQTKGARDNMDFDIEDVTAKIVQRLDADHALTLKATFHTEDNQIPYSGLTRAEYDRDPRFNPFVNDDFQIERTGVSLVHRWDANATTRLVTAVYYAEFHRDWWRQSSNSAQRPNDASDPACGGLINLNTTCGNEGRLRDYRTAGLETRLTTELAVADLPVTLEAGARIHDERQRRRQINGDVPRARSAGRSRNAGVVEDNLRLTRAYAGFVQGTVDLGKVQLQPGLRVEHVEFDRTNRLNGRSGETDLTELIPGFGATWMPDPRLTLFAGLHRGFAPPRVEDVLTNAGGAVDLDAELSWNAELGARARPLPGVSLEATAFRLDFENQIVPASVAGGIGATSTSAGETLHQGLELGVELSSRALADLGPHEVTLTGTYTWVADAEYRGRRFSAVPGFANVSVAGNRLPYAPEHLGLVSLGYAYEGGPELQLDLIYTGDMFTDDLNSETVSVDGQRGRIKSHTLVNLAGELPLGETGVSLVASVKNLFDRTYVVDRSRGTIPGNPFQVQAGVRVAF